MHKNVIWQAFLAIVFLATLWFTFSALFAYYTYSHLEGETTTSSITWNIEDKSEDAYFLKADYRFSINDHLYAGTTSFPKETYRNRWTAEQEIKERSIQQKVWFDLNNPNLSSLQKNFPFKESLSAIFLWGLLLYFLWLGFYVAKFKT